jgi:hypothetical protein
VRGSFLDVAQRDAGVQRCGDERVPQRVGSYLLGDPGMAGYPADDAPGAVPVQPPPGRCQEERSFAALADGQVNRTGSTGCQRDGDDLAALGRDHQGTVAALGA